jgi:hypothetical protein
MPEPSDEEGRQPPGKEEAPRRTGSTAPRGKSSGKKSLDGGHGRIDCDVHDGVPTVRGKAHAHYLTGQSGQRMLVVARKPGERIRINDTTEVVILEVGPNQVTMSVETTDVNDSSGGSPAEKK